MRIKWSWDSRFDVYKDDRYEVTTTDNRVGSKDSDDNDSTAKKTTTGKNINDYIEYELLL